jgi:hypothetical protein
LPAATGPVGGIVNVLNSDWAALNQTIYISDGTNFAHFSVISKPSSTEFTLQWLDYPGDAIGTTVIANGAQVSPSGVLATLSGAIPTPMVDNTGGSASDTLAVGVGVATTTIPLTSLATGLSTLAIDLLTNYTPGYAFKLLSFDWVTTIVGAGAGASQTFNLEIGATNVTGGVLNPTLASTAGIGSITAGTAITALNVGTAADSISIEMAAGGTVFSSGSGYFVIRIKNMDTANAFASIADYLNDLLAALA